MVNCVVLVGHLGADAQSQTLPSGSQKASFRLAVDDRRRSPTGERITQTYWFNVSVFGKQAESILRYGKKGKKVAITGRLVSNKYTRRTDNVEVTVYEIIANQVEFLSPRDSEDASDSGYMPDESAADPILSDKANAKQDDYSDVLEGDLPF